MKDFIAEEKAKLQSLFDAFNRDGSWMDMREGRDEPLEFGLIDSYIVTRVSPHFDSSGNVTKIDFWLLFKSAGYHNGWQYSHTIKVVAWSRDDTYLLDLTDDRGRRFHIELIMDVSEHDMVLDWRTWQSYKAANQQMFEEIDLELMEEHVRIAETWE
ncbi:MAG: hypothetical protein ABFD46_08230 [Armatimonadota bacterium]